MSDLIDKIERLLEKVRQLHAEVVELRNAIAALSEPPRAIDMAPTRVHSGVGALGFQSGYRCERCSQWTSTPIGSVNNEHCVGSLNVFHVWQKVTAPRSE